MGAPTHHSRDHSNHGVWLNDFAGALRSVASCRESAMWINGGDAVADEVGVVPEYYDCTYGNRGRRTEFKFVALLNRRRHA
jgi:hypothetical protein